MRSSYHDETLSSHSYPEQFSNLDSWLSTTLFWHRLEDIGRYLHGKQRRRPGSNNRRTQGISRLALTPLALIVLWGIILRWGERSIFRNALRSCEWGGWEKWDPAANPHHAVLIADPQLVDPHTYPGRPWPLSSLTTLHTDRYIRRSFSWLNKSLRPDTVIFLGDLFDGGREWATVATESVDSRYKRYRQDFWLQEYRRFGDIFFDAWIKDSEGSRPGQRGRKIIAGLPGNHDLGLGSGIALPVRARFNAFFGDGNGVDVVGNHTFVSVDTVSLSAKGQSDPEMDSQGAGDGEEPNKQIWAPVEEFLSTVKTKKQRVIDRELRFQGNDTERDREIHDIIDINEALYAEKPLDGGVTDLPSILLTHVPLYREPETPCGPHRERWPPSRTDGKPLEKDGRNSILVQAGYQYQNVLTPSISSELIDKVGNIQYVFSGDDHDYCEVIHRGYTSETGGIHEVTVKSISWAMGVRKPGFLMLSLWNPIDRHGSSLKSREGHTGSPPTLQSHLCLLPDQLSIFMRYILLGLFSVAVLMIRALLIGFGKITAHSADISLLPINVSRSLVADNGLARMKADSSSGVSSIDSGSPQYENGHVASRTATTRPRSLSPSGGYGFQADKSKPTSMNSWGDVEKYKTVDVNLNDNSVLGTGFAEDQSKRRRRSRLTVVLTVVLHELRWTLWRVSWVSGLWYLWLIWSE